jgi:Arc/MetJ-type ribon-helix-helix transcriptional regulator
MTITLMPEHEELIAEAMRTGAYRSPEEVIAVALEMLRSENEWIRDHQQEISEKIDRALAQFERGEFLTSEESRIDMEKRKAEWLRM